MLIMASMPFSTVCSRVRIAPSQWIVTSVRWLYQRVHHFVDIVITGSPLYHEHSDRRPIRIRFRTCRGALPLTSQLSLVRIASRRKEEPPDLEPLPPDPSEVIEY
jgi:hypothetical protein